MFHFLLKPSLLFLGQQAEVLRTNLLLSNDLHRARLKVLAALVVAVRFIKQRAPVDV